MTKLPCKVCLPGVPRHTRQRVVMREDGARVQVCERCSTELHVLDTLPERADKIIQALKDIDRLSGDEKPSDHADYNRELVLAKLRHSWSPR